MKNIFIIVALFVSFSLTSAAQNRFFLKDGSHVDGTVNSFFGNTINLTIKLTSGGIQEDKIYIGDVVKILGPLDKSRIKSFSKKNPSIRFEANAEFVEEKYGKKTELEPISFDNFIPSVKLVPFEYQQKYFRDGSEYQSYDIDSIRVVMTVWKEKNFGKYYTAFIAIENNTSDHFIVDPKYFEAYIYNNKVMSVKVFTHEEYSQIVNRRQNWNHALVAFGEASMANNAGFSNSSSNISTNNNSSTNFNASGNIGTTYSNVYGNVNTSSNSNTQINTKSYNGAAHYNAMQQASQNTAEYRENQTRQRESLNKGYLKINTVFSSTLTD